MFVTRRRAVLFVVDVDAARTALHARMLACPQHGCEGRLQPWSPARTRTVTVRPGEQVRLTPDRGRCGWCRVSQTLLPAWYVPGRSCGIEVIGAAIGGRVNVGHSHARVAQVLGLPRTTVRAWLRGITGAAETVRALTRHVVAGIGTYVSFPQLQQRPDCTPATQDVARAFAELTYAASALTRPDPPSRSASATGIDYLHLLGQQARRAADRLLRLADPTGARITLGVWPAINLASGGRLLNMIASPGPAT
jgi:hypothetical protein